jgi:lipid-binding SYLF domain-containing protein
MLARTPLVVLALVSSPLGCSRQPPPSNAQAEQGYEQQKIVDRAAQSVRSIRNSPRLAPRFEELLPQARAVVVFPRLIKASMLFGGQGGNGVMVARRADGSWSAPAFYSLGAASAGLQIGYQETSAVLLLMRDRIVQAALDSDFRFGGDASVAVGYVGEGGKDQKAVASDDIYVFTEVGGAYAGISFDGYVMGPRRTHDERYYGRPVTHRQILLEGAVDVPGSAVLRDALGPRPAATGTPVAPPDTPVTSPAPAGTAGPGAPPSADTTPTFHDCSPESRQAEACAEIYQPVCGESDTGVRCVRAPCPESRSGKTYPNACAACREPSVLGYRDGPCPGE